MTPKKSHQQEIQPAHPTWADSSHLADVASGFLSYAVLPLHPARLMLGLGIVVAGVIAFASHAMSIG